MKNLIQLSVKRPIATSVIYALVCGAGLLVWSRIPQEVMPDLNFPQLTVVTEYPQASPQEIENLVTKPIEESVGTVKNVREVRSVSKEGVSLVTVEFWWGTNMDFASLGIREKLDLVKSRLPLDIREPVVVKYNPFAAPVLILSLTGREEVDLSFLTHIAKKTIANRLQKVEGVAAVDISGDRDVEIQVDLDQNRLAAYQVPLLQFNRGLSQSNYDGAAGTAKEGTYDYAVRVFTPFSTAEHIKSAVISVDDPTKRASFREDRLSSVDRQGKKAVQGDSRLISVSQVGQVNEGLKERSSYSRLDGKETITIMVQKQASASTLRTAKNIKVAIEELKPLLPSDVETMIVYDQALIIASGIQDVLFSVLSGGLLAFFALYFFLKSWRDALIVSAIIPTSLLATLIVMHLSGITLNTISLGGLALGMGMLVDAAVCVTENIHRRRSEYKEDLETAIVQGTEEVVTPVISSNLTSIAVFLPLFFVLGLMGQLFRDLSLTVCISQVISIVVAITLIPTLYKLIADKAGPTTSTEFSSPFFIRFREWYLGKLDWSLSQGKPLFTTIAVVFVISILVLALLPRQFLPAIDTDQIICKLSMPNGALLEKTNETAMMIEQEAKKISEVDHITTTVGSSNQSALKLLDKNEAQLLIDLKKDRSRPADAVIEDLRASLAAMSLPGGKIEISKAGGPLSFVKSQTSPVMVVLKGIDLDKLTAASAKLVGELESVQGLAHVRHSLALPAPEIRLHIDKERAARLGLTVSDIGQTAGAAYHGRDVTKIHREGKEIPVKVRLRSEDRASIQQLRSLLLPLSGGGTIPLSDVASLQMAESPSQISRLDQERFVLVQADAEAGFSSADQKKVKSIVQSFSFPQVTVEESSEKKSERESFKSLAFVILVSILLVYAIMAVQFESFTQPLLILLTIPLSVIGMALGLFMTGKSMSAMAAMGFLLLGGIVVNNGIVLIDFVNSEMEKYKNLRQALIEACRTRLRPILVTATTTAIGLIPLALGIGEGAELQAPMAITVIFGLMVSTVLTLVALPTLFLVVDNWKEARQS
ncbi:MAG: Swarming motility protein SwrC [Elusimicrobia bacterium]|nr:Swarming motility protein SwrC [Elusimicrobiota bacterium]